MEEHQSSIPEHSYEEEYMRHQTEKKEPLPYAIPFSIILAGVIVASAIVFTNRTNIADIAGTGKQLAAAQTGSTLKPADMQALGQNAPMLGDPRAPVTVVEFADYQCPFCGRFYQTTEKSIIDTYVKTGKVKFVFRDFAFLGEESSLAAQAARCAGDQGKYWQYHDYLFDHQNGENEGSFAASHLKIFAQTLGLATSQFNNCLDSGTHKKEVEDDTALGRKFGVNGTPSSFVNGAMITGAVPFNEFDQKIKEALNGK